MRVFIMGVALATSICSCVAQGIKFQAPLRWNQVLAKARKEHKGIFVDCFASWCVPCKIMDRDIYPKAAAAKAINGKYIAVRMQMDLAGNEQEEGYISKTYHIEGYPTLLYLSADGALLAKHTGTMGIQDFVRVAGDALDSSQQFGFLRKQYDGGTLAVQEFQKLADKADQQNERDLAFAVRKDYVHRYFDGLADSAVIKADNLLFLANHSEVVNLDDRYFRLCTHNRESCDKALPGAAEGIVRAVATREAIMGKLDVDDPNWTDIEQNFREWYKGADTAMIFLQIKIDYMSRRKNWTAVVETIDALLQRCPGYLESPQHVQQLNNYAWYGIFLNTADAPLLERALVWSDSVIHRQPIDEYKDTKANILYKLGRKDEAIALEQAIVDGLVRASGKDAATAGGDYYKTVEKMRQGSPTW